MASTNLNSLSTSRASLNPNADETLLDNPIYNSLGTGHKLLALIHDRARRFPADIGPLAGIPDQSAESYADLSVLADTGSPIVLFLQDAPAPPAGWTLVRGGQLDQMVCVQPLASDAPHGPNAAHSMNIRRLTATDVPAMIELARLTEPGPFQRRTIELGAFFGIFHGDRLMAMSGQRLNLPGFVEVSAVCTHPEARGRGYAPALMARVMEHIRAQAKTPMLHSFSNNTPAIAVYRSLGFVFRRSFQLAVLRNDL
jgi:GNAT superfamily N-acetyltransferase